MNADENSAQEVVRQVMSPYFFAEVNDSDIFQTAVLDILVQVRECDALA